MACTYCIQGLNKPLDAFIEVDPDIVKTYFGKDTECTIVFYGGEPLLKFDYLIKLTTALKDYNDKLNFAVITNGLLLTIEKAKKLNELGIIVTLSHDGYNFEKMRCMPDILAENPEPYLTLNKRTISATVSRLNYDYYDIWNYFDEFVIKHDLDKKEKVKINLIRNAGGYTDKALLIEDMPEFEVMLDKTFANLEHNIRIGNFDSYEFQQYQPMIYSLNYMINNNGNISAYCGADGSVAHMDIFGNLYPCHNLDTPNGHVKDKGIRSGEFNPYIGTENCKSCEAYLYWGGGCVAVPPELKEYDCYVIKEQYNRIIAMLHSLGESICKQ